MDPSLKLAALQWALGAAGLGAAGCASWFDGPTADPAAVTADAAPADRPLFATDGALAFDGGPARVDAAAPDRPLDDVALLPPGEPAARGESVVCAQWHALTDGIASVAGWSAGASACEPGALPPATRAGAVQYTNAYRWLAGLAPVRDDDAQTAEAQACAVLLERNGQLSHTPPDTWACWSPLGYQGTSGSNITGLRGFAMTSRAAVDGWVDDGRDLTLTLGHRRWMLYPPLSTVGYGQTSGYACLYILGGITNPRAQSYVAWPNAGPTPMAAMTRTWSLSSASLGVGAGTRVEVARDGVALVVAAQLRAGNYGDPTVSWDMPAITAGSAYAVRVTGLAGADLRYEVRPAACP